MVMQPGFDADDYADDLSNAFGDCKKANCTDIPKGFYHAAKDTQTQYILGKDWKAACHKDDDDPCATAAFLIGKGVDSGAKTL